MRSNIAWIDGLRALAAFWVMSAHCMIWSGWIPALMPDPKRAVDLFMMISGYLMVVHAAERGEPFDLPSSWAKFYLRRFFRLAPTYYFTLALVVMTAPAFLGGYAALRSFNPAWGGDQVYDPHFVHFTFRNIILHCTFLFGLLPNYAFSTFLPDWSLGLEMQFYAVFPAFFLTMRRWGTWLTALMVCAVSLPLTTYLGTLTGMRGGTGLFVEPSFLPLKIHIFLLGMIAAQVRAPAIPPMINWICRTRLVRYMSDASYAVYLVHGFFIAYTGYFLFKPGGLGELSNYQRFLVLWPLVTLGSYMSAWIVRRCIELPGINAGKRLIAMIS